MASTLGHPSDKVVRYLPFSVKSTSNVNKACDVCHRAKHSRTTFPVSDSRATSCSEIIHFDLWGKYHTPSSCGASYFLTLVEDYSNPFGCIFFLTKLRLLKCYILFILRLSDNLMSKLKWCVVIMVQSLNVCVSFFESNGILFQTSCIDTPQKNGRVERNIAII